MLHTLDSTLVGVHAACVRTCVSAPAGVAFLEARAAPDQGPRSPRFLPSSPHARPLLLLGPACGAAAGCLSRGVWAWLAAAARACAALLHTTLRVRGWAGSLAGAACWQPRCAVRCRRRQVRDCNSSWQRCRLRARCALAPAAHTSKGFAAALPRSAAGSKRRLLVVHPAACVTGSAPAPRVAARSRRRLRLSCATLSRPKPSACPNNARTTKADAAACRARAAACVWHAARRALWATTARSSCSRTACLQSTDTSAPSATTSCATQPPASRATGACLLPCACGC
jgi:hypothetical protein